MKAEATELNIPILSGGDMDKTELFPMHGSTEQNNAIMSAGDETNPQEELLNALISNNLVLLLHCMALSKVDLNYIYKPLNRSTCLHYAVKQGQIEAVTALLAARVRTDITDQDGLLPLHLAVKGGHDAILHELLWSGADVNAQNQQLRGALHLLVMQWTDAPQKYEGVLETLLAAPEVYVDIRDCSGCTPLLLAAQLSAAKLCRRLAEKGADLDYCVGTHCARDLLQTKFPLLLEEMPPPEKPKEPGPSVMLYQALRSDQEEKFDVALARVRALDKDACSKALERIHGKRTCLEYAAQNGMAREVGKLLEAGADCGYGYESVSDSGSGSLISVSSDCWHPSAFYFACYKGYYQVLDHLLKAVKKKAEKGHIVDLLQTDPSGLTLLHQLVTQREFSPDPQKDPSSCLNLLLECKQPVGVNAQDIFGYTPLHFAAQNDDQSLLVTLIKHGADVGKADKLGKKPIDLIKEASMKKAFDCSVKGNDLEHVDDKDFRITFNYDCLVPPADLEVQTVNQETMLLFTLSQSQRHKKLLLHPVLSSFLTVKWHFIRWLYLLAVMLYATFVAILTAYVYLEFDVDPKTCELCPSSLVSAGGLVTMKVALWLVLVLLVLRELLDLTIFKCDYFFDSENYLHVGLIMLLAMLLIGAMSEVTQLYIAIFVIIFAWLELVLLLGRHPWFSIYIMMFKKVSGNFIKFIFLYSFLFISFSIAFNLMFRTDKHYSTYLRALLRTVIMSTGEMEYSSLEFMHPAYLGRIVFFGFIFLIVLVLMNLLNGLAVSDTAKIQEDAELNSLIARVSLIHYTEAAVLRFGGVGRQVCCSGRTAATRCYNPCSWLARHIFLVSRCVKCRSMTMNPNAECSQLECSGKCGKINIDKKVVEAAHALLRRDHVPDDRMTAIERKLDELLKMGQMKDAKCA